MGQYSSKCYTVASATLCKSICTTEASDYWLGAKYSVIYVLLPINKII